MKETSRKQGTLLNVNWRDVIGPAISGVTTLTVYIVLYL